MVKRLIDYISHPYALMGTSLARIGFGVLILYFYTIHYAQRSFLWGPNGLIDFDTFLVTLNEAKSISLYQISSSPLYFEVIFHLGILAALVFTIGYKGKISGIINFIFLWSIHERNHVILDGGDNIMRIMLIYLFFANTTKYFSVDAYINKERNLVAKQTYLSSVLHNFAVLAAITQLCLMVS